MKWSLRSGVQGSVASYPGPRSCGLGMRPGSLLLVWVKESFEWIFLYMYYMYTHTHTHTHTQSPFQILDQTPMETVVEIFRKMGLRQILVSHKGWELSPLQPCAPTNLQHQTRIHLSVAIRNSYKNSHKDSYCDQRSEAREYETRLWVILCFPLPILVFHGSR